MITNKYYTSPKETSHNFLSPLRLTQLCSYFFPLAALLLGARIFGAVTSFSDSLCTFETNAAAATLRARPALAATGSGNGTFSFSFLHTNPFRRVLLLPRGALPQRRADADDHTPFAGGGHGCDAIRSCARSAGTRSVGRPPASPGSAQGTSTRTCALVLRLRSSSLSLPTPCSAPNGQILRGGILHYVVDGFLGLDSNAALSRGGGRGRGRCHFHRLATISRPTT